MDTITDPTCIALPVDELTTDALEQQTINAEASIARIRAAQMVLIGEADRRQIRTADGCRTIVGCTSRYRLRAHHIIPWSQGGATDAENLTAMCWFHHHIAIHARGFRIDPDTPAQRRRLLPPIHAAPTG